MVQIVVVGSGVAALMATRTLLTSEKNGLHVTWCTSRSKLATQMGPKNQTPPKPGQPYFDYGCQYVTPSSDIAKDELTRWERLGYAQAIPDGQVGVMNSGTYTPLAGDLSFVANGGFGPLMTSLTKQTVNEYKDRLTHVSGFPSANNRVVGFQKDASKNEWFLNTKGGDRLGPFDIVIGAFGQHVLTDPFLITGGAHSEAMLKCVRRVESNQIIVIQMVLEKGSVNNDLVAAHVQGDSVLSFVSNNSRKPQQDGKWGTPGKEHWTLLSTAEFAEREFNTNGKGYRRAAEEKMLASFAKEFKLGTLQEFREKYQPSINRINHWEDGLPIKKPPNSQGCLFDVDENLGWCGDFCVAPSIDGAARSGVQMANVILRRDKISSDEKDWLLPSDIAWVPMDQRKDKSITVDIGEFGHNEQDGLASISTHTDLVPSAIDGYQKKKAHLGASGGRNNRGQGRNNRKKNSGQSKNSRQ